jgi:capsular polysaccharide biosynthesis protein
MKRFARCVLILILVTVIGGVCGYFYEDSTLTPMYTSTAQLYVVPGEANEATIRAADGGLKDDFVIIFKSSVVITEAQKLAGTSEDIAQYLTVSSPANSNIVEITCTNPDQNTAKTYVDAVAKTALKTTTIIPVNSIQILSEGTSTNEQVKPGLYRNTIAIAVICAAICFGIELIVVLILCAFKKPVDHSDDESEYEKYYGRLNMALENRNAAERHSIESTHKHHEHKSESKKSEHEDASDMRDILEDFDEDYVEDDDYQGEEDTQESPEETAEQETAEQETAERETAEQESPEQETAEQKSVEKKKVPDDSIMSEFLSDDDIEEEAAEVETPEAETESDVESVIEEEVVDNEAAVSEEVKKEADETEDNQEAYTSEASIEAALEEQVITEAQQEETVEEISEEEDTDEVTEEVSEEVGEEFDGPQILQSSAQILGIIKK